MHGILRMVAVLLFICDRLDLHDCPSAMPFPATHDESSGGMS